MAGRATISPGTVPRGRRSRATNARGACGRPTDDRAIVDAGSKVLTREQYYVKHFGHVVEYPEAVVANASEEHGILDLSACLDKPQVGDVINIIPNHCCVVSNMVDEVQAVRGGRVETVLAVAARGKVQ